MSLAALEHHQSGGKDGDGAAKPIEAHNRREVLTCCPSSGGIEGDEKAWKKRDVVYLICCDGTWDCAYVSFEVSLPCL